MHFTRRSAVLALTILCFGCAQVPGAQYEVGSYQPPPSAQSVGAPPVTFQNTQSPGFTTTTGAAVEPQDTIFTAGGNEISTSVATGIAIIGLVALILLAEEGCLGTACEPDGEPEPAM